MLPKRSPLLAAPWAVLFLWLALVLPSLDRSHMQEVDELTHARVAQSAALDGHWWPLELDGRAFYEKPPLLLWLAGATAKLSGRPYDAWPYRLWTCLAAGLALACLVLIGGLLDRPWVGLLAAAALALQGDFIYHARFFTFDTPYLACLFASLAFSLRAVRSEKADDWWWAGLALALAAAFKSWFVLALIPAYACAVFLHVPPSRRQGALARLGLPSLAVLLLWILLYIDWNGWGFLREEYSSNLAGRVMGRGFTLDPDGHSAFYLKWAAWTAPAVLPWVLAAPLALVTDNGPDPGAAGRARTFVRTWVCAFCASWLLGLALVRTETNNYALPLEAALCLAAGMTLDARLPRGRELLRTGLLLASLLAALRLWDPFWSLGLGAVLGLAWLFAKQPAPGPRPKAWVRTGALNLVLGLSLAGLLGREAYGLLERPLDPNRSLAELLLAHPARSKGETLLLIPWATQAPNFYSSYQVRVLAALPARRPAEACLIKTRTGWAFFPAQTTATVRTP